MQREPNSSWLLVGDQFFTSVPAPVTKWKLLLLAQWQVRRSVSSCIQEKLGFTGTHWLDLSVKRILFFFFFCIFWLLLGSCALWYNFMIRTSFTMVLASLITELLSPAPSPAHHHPQESPPVPESIVQTLPEICQPWCCDTSALGSQFQCANILWVKNLSNLNLPWHYVRPFPQILSLGTSEEISVFPYDVLLKLFSSISHPFKLIKF